MIQPICRMGNPVLRNINEALNEIDVKSEWFGQLLESLQDSMKHYGGIGIAAPQIGVNKKVAIIDLPENNRYGEVVKFPFTVFINPEIEFLTSEKKGYWEGCLSVPGLRGFVERPQKIKVTFFDLNWEKQEMIVEGFAATVVQHELDHLEGILYVDKVLDPKLLSYQEEFENYIFNPTLE